MDGTAALAVLGLAPGASRHEIRRAYRRCALRAHPDQRGEAAGFRLLHRAYEAALAAAPQPTVFHAPAGAPLPRPTPSRWVTGSTGRPPTVDLTDIAPSAPQPSPAPPVGDFERVLAAALAA